MTLLPIYLCLIWLLNCDATDEKQIIIEIGRPLNQTYSVATQICCNGILYTRDKTNSTSCCGEKTYDPLNELCCFPNIYPKQGTEKCCGNQTYNPQTHDCYSKIVTSGFGEEGFRSLSFKRGQRFFTTPHIDTHNLLVSTCGEQIIYFNQSICCDGKIVPGAHLRCCIDKAFDPVKEVCCFKDKLAVIVTKTQPTDNGCCNGIPFNRDKKVCIKQNGTIIDPPGPNKMLCGDQVIDATEELCCYGRVLPDKSEYPEYKQFSINKVKSHHNRCCGNQSYSAYSKEEICCDDVLTPQSQTLQCCPGSGVYDPEKDTCCWLRDKLSRQYISKLHKDKLGECCHLELPKKDTEYCCGVTVMPITDGNNFGCCQYQLNASQATLPELVAAHKRRKVSEDYF